MKRNANERRECKGCGHPMGDHGCIYDPDALVTTVMERTCPTYPTTYAPATVRVNMPRTNRIAVALANYAGAALAR
jgi:hypothetical protein